MAGAAPTGRKAIITPDGSIATTRRPAGSYEPVPAPTLTTEIASPSASSIRRARAVIHPRPGLVR
jgi:hypothetical protein